jgi:hypothetical protein
MSAKLIYRVNGGTWAETAMTGTAGLYTGYIPQLQSGVTVDYYLRAADVVGLVSLQPPGAPTEHYTFRITQMVYSSDCEDPGDPNWALGVSGDQATTGVWIRDDPVGTDYGGTIVQPEDDHTPDPGVKCFVTGNANPGEVAGTNDVDGGCTTLQSPTFALASSEQAFLTYWRWYGEAGNALDDEFAVDISSDGGANWLPVERVPDIANSWTRVTVDLTTLITMTDQVVVRFLACDLNTAGLIEAAIDDVSIEVFIPNTVGTLETPARIPVFQLDASRPNPFSQGTTIRFSLAQAGPVSLVLYDVGGREVRRLIQGVRAAGPHSVSWDGRDDRGEAVPSGIYFMRLAGQDQSDVRKMIRLE